MLRKNRNRIGKKLSKLHPNTEIGGGGWRGERRTDRNHFENVAVFLSCTVAKTSRFCSLSCLLVPLLLLACLSVCLSVYPFYLSALLPACLSGWLAVFLSVCVYVCVSVFLSVCLSVWMSVCLSVGCSRALRLLLLPLFLHSVIVCLSC